MTREKRKFRRSRSIRSTHSVDNEDCEFWRVWAENVPEVVLETVSASGFEDPILPADYTPASPVLAPLPLEPLEMMLETFVF